MFCRALLVAGLLFIAGCAVGERPTLTEDGIESDGTDAEGGAVVGGATATVPVGGAADESGEVAPAGGELPSLAALGDVPPVLVSPTGVVVPVIGRADEGYLVRTPCGNDQELLWGQPLGPVDVVIDPGHGGAEDGAVGPSGETEKEVNLDLARRTAVLLEARGLNVALTRTSDYRITISNRAAIADRLQADVFISIHHNSPNPDINEDRTIPGTEVYTQVGSEESSRLGGLLYDQVLGALSVFDAEWASRTDAGVLTVLNDEGTDAYGIVRRPTVPTALIELAYLSNETEALVIGTSEYRQSAAAALAEAIALFLQSTETGSGFVAEPRLFNPSASTGGSDGCVDPALD